MLNDIWTLYSTCKCIGKLLVGVSIIGALYNLDQFYPAHEPFIRLTLNISRLIFSNYTPPPPPPPQGNLYRQGTKLFCEFEDDQNYQYYTCVFAT